MNIDLLKIKEKEFVKKKEFIEINYISNTEQHLQIQMHALELKLT